MFLFRPYRITSVFRYKQCLFSLTKSCMDSNLLLSFFSYLLFLFLFVVALFLFVFVVALSIFFLTHKYVEYQWNNAGSDWHNHNFYHII